MARRRLMKRNRRRTRASLERTGAALVETAVCLPLILVLVVGSIEMSNGVFQQHAVRAAAHECARIAASGEKQGTDVQYIANEVLTQRGIDNFDIDIDVTARTVNTGTVQPPTTTHFDVPESGTPTAGLENVPRGTLLRLKLTATRPAGPVGSTFLGPVISTQVFFVKER